MRIGAATTLAGLLLATAMASIAGAQGNLRGILRMGADFGGDRVLEFQYEDGSTPDVTAGGGLLLSAGAALEIFRSLGSAIDIQISAGIKYRTIPPATNQDATWIRWPIEGLVMYRSPFGLKAGGGVAVHLANVLEASGAVLDDRVEFKNTPGVVLQVEYARRAWAFDVRYTLMQYESSSGGSGRLNADSFGLGVSYAFGRSVAKSGDRKIAAR